MKQPLTIELLKQSAKEFCKSESIVKNKELFGVTDGKKVGTHIEHKFQNYLSSKFTLNVGSSSKGIDLPGANIQTDIKVTSINKPQSSCPFKDAKQKIFGLGYNILVFVYDKQDDDGSKTAILDFVSCTFIPKEFTGDYSTTRIINEMKKVKSGKDDFVAFLTGIKLPVDEISMSLVADKIIETKIQEGCLTISNALQWRLSYSWICPNKNGKSKPLNKLIGPNNIIHKVTYSE